MYSGRKSPRRNVFQIGKVYNLDGTPLVECILRDISATGAKLELREDVPLPDSFVLALTCDGSVRRPCETVWQLSIVVGVCFSGESSTDGSHMKEGGTGSWKH
jgi:hypothetical protein